LHKKVQGNNTHAKFNFKHHQDVSHPKSGRYASSKVETFRKHLKAIWQREGSAQQNEISERKMDGYWRTSF